MLYTLLIYQAEEISDSCAPPDLEKALAGHRMLQEETKANATFIAANEQHLPVQIVHLADRALGDMRWQRQGIGGNPPGCGSGRGEGEEMSAAGNAGQAPERVRHHTEVGRRWRRRQVEGSVVIPRA